MSWVRRLERFFWVAGLLLIALWAAVKIHSYVGSRRDLERFEAAKSAARSTPLPPLPVTPAPELGLAPAPPARMLPELPPDYALWSKERVKAYEDARAQQASAPLAVLRIPRIDLQVAVLEGTDDFTLNRAVGHIENTDRPGENGNIGLAGHRDGFFRGLKDVRKGDTMEIETLSGRDTYRITDIWIVNPDDAQVLNPTPQPSVTLVACYPFYFVGHAPKRYIVRAVREARIAASRVAAAAP
ncbi:MAG: class D sortase [Syntrophomonadaceae bacterium]